MTNDDTLSRNIPRFTPAQYPGMAPAQPAVTQDLRLRLLIEHVDRLLDQIDDGPEISGFAPVTDAPRASDAVTLRCPRGHWRFGLMIAVEGRLGAVHSDGFGSLTGPRSRLLPAATQPSTPARLARKACWTLPL